VSPCNGVWQATRQGHCVDESPECIVCKAAVATFKAATGVVQHEPSSAPAASTRSCPRMPRNGMHWLLQAAWQQRKIEATRVRPRGSSAQTAAQGARAGGVTTRANGSEVSPRIGDASNPRRRRDNPRRGSEVCPHRGSLMGPCNGVWQAARQEYCVDESPLSRSVQGNSSSEQNGNGRRATQT
jgi:nitrite reductase/ring-hydroxylating ferredoxin subunit